MQQVTLLSAGIGAAAKEPGVARQLVRFFTSPAVAPVITENGLEPAQSR